MEIDHKLKLGGIEAALKRLEKEDLQDYDKAYFERYRSSNKSEDDIRTIITIIKELADVFNIKSEISRMMSYK